MTPAIERGIEGLADRTIPKQSIAPPFKRIDPKDLGHPEGGVNKGGNPHRDRGDDEDSLEQKMSSRLSAIRTVARKRTRRKAPCASATRVDAGSSEIGCIPPLAAPKGRNASA
ncbi:hypothetical protein OUZ56_032462 [Daphnia magna]|uniref:Uncharacterized protein n=1 Tax=Daphnia magna TaxID=35525 RepID=A0ABR0B8Z1_9CRUS|nr:hypothetical protein OUZ56_032462 [Daphnia magna]